MRASPSKKSTCGIEAESLADLLRRTGSAYLCVSTDPRLSRAAEVACDASRSDGQQVTVLKMPEFEDLFSSHSTSTTDAFLKPKRRDLDAPTIILHSSGGLFTLLQPDQ